MSYVVEGCKFKSIQEIYDYLTRTLGINISYGGVYYRIKIKKAHISEVLKDKGMWIPPSRQALRLSQSAKKRHNKRYKNCMANTKNNILRMKLESTDLQLI
jgi:hypothetical protein